MSNKLKLAGSRPSHIERDGTIREGFRMNGQTGSERRQTLREGVTVLFEGSVASDLNALARSLRGPKQE